MAIQVKNLAIKLQTGSDSTYYATWDAPVSTVTTTTTNGSVKVGSLVSIKAGATYYNGVAIPDWVKSQKWYVHSVSGDRVVINKNQSGTNAIMSPVHVRYLSGGSSSSSSSTTETAVTNVDCYKVDWRYSSGDGVWFKGAETQEKERHATYSSVPSNAITIRVLVTPVSKTYEVKTTDNEGREKTETKSYWTGTAASADLSMSKTKPTAPSGLTASIEKFKLTASVENISDVRTDQMEFEVYNGTKKVTSGKVTVLTARAIFTYDVAAGGEYRVRCRAINTTGGTSYSDWTDFTSTMKTIPSTVTNVKCAADSKTSIKVTWDAISSAESYTVQYTTNKDYFDTSNVTPTTVDTNTAYITGLENGRTWYFRVKATNKQGDSGWSSIVSQVIGTKPEPPTTWSLTTVASVGEDVILYWTHNSEDGSNQTEAELSISVDGTTEYVTVTSSVDEEEDEPVYSYTIDTSKYSDGGEIQWMVKTKGITDEFSDWSTQRTINVFAPPTLILTPTLDIDDVLRSLPLAFTAVAGPANQNPISYHISVTANNAYRTTDNVGNDKFVMAGSDVYSKVVVSDAHEITESISAGDITLETGQEYTLNVTVSMDSGLTATASKSFSVAWVTKEYICDASIMVDSSTLSAHISPFCLGEDDVLTENVVLSVYRREADGTFTEIATGLSNTMVTTVTDPHPSLDYARYRIIATDLTTGAVEYSDLPGIPVKEPSIVIQWDEQWVNFDYDMTVAAPDVPPWTGSMVRIPYNVDVSETYNADVSLVEYMGRKSPVSYYGTQRGIGGSWSASIPKSDKETIYALRRLKEWMGDVYVREPSGIGYWAQIKVSMSQKHRDVTIPVSFDITRVEGGK